MQRQRPWARPRPRKKRCLKDGAALAPSHVLRLRNLRNQENNDARGHGYGFKERRLAKELVKGGMPLHLATRVALDGLDGIATDSDSTSESESEGLYSECNSKMTEQFMSCGGWVPRMSSFGGWDFVGNGPPGPVAEVVPADQMRATDAVDTADADADDADADDADDADDATESDSDTRGRLNVFCGRVGRGSRFLIDSVYTKVDVTALTGMKTGEPPNKNAEGERVNACGERLWGWEGRSTERWWKYYRNQERWERARRESWQSWHSISKDYRDKVISHLHVPGQQTPKPERSVYPWYETKINNPRAFVTADNSQGSLHHNPSVCYL